MSADDQHKNRERLSAILETARRERGRVGGLNVVLPDAEYVRWTDKRALSDFSTVVAAIQPSNLSESLTITSAYRHWRAEFEEFFRGGKTLVVFVGGDFVFHVFTEEGMQPANCLLVFGEFATIVGELAARHPKETATGQKLFKEHQQLRAALDAKFVLDVPGGKPLLTTADDTGRCFAVEVSVQNGRAIFLPGTVADASAWPYPSQKGSFFENVRRIKTAQINFALAVSKQVATLPPKWALGDVWQTKDEQSNKAAVEQFNVKMAELSQRKSAAEKAIRERRRLRALLHASGDELERTVRATLSAFGLDAKPFSHEQDHMDVRFEYRGTIIVGEVEGKDNKAIEVGKFRQLLQILHGEVMRTGESTQVRGILFGNAFRMLPPEERPEFFTEYVRNQASKNDIILVPTHELYAAWKDFADGIVTADLVTESLLNHSGGVWTWTTQET